MAHATLGSRFVWALIGATTVLTAACESPAAPRSAAADVPVRITAVTVGTPISTLIVEVTAADLPATLVFNLGVVNGVASGTIKIPPGPARTIHVTAVDDHGDVTHEGSTTIDVRPGQNIPVQIKLAPRSGHVPISVTFGNFGVVVTPPAATIAATGQVQLAVTVTDVNGQVIAAPQVGWATTQPAIATVSGQGLVTGVLSGSATIVATYEGVAGLSVITVTGGASTEICDGLDNDLDGQIDNGLRYCVNGVPAPHSDGNVCLPGFFDGNQNPADGCEVQLDLVNGVWSLAPAITTTCTGSLVSGFPALAHPSLDKVTTDMVEPGVLLFLFNLAGNSLSLQVPIDLTNGSFGGSGSAAGQVTATASISGLFIGPSNFTMAVKVTNIQLQSNGLSATCLDIDQSAIGTRL